MKKIVTAFVIVGMMAACGTAKEQGTKNSTESKSAESVENVAIEEQDDGKEDIKTRPVYHATPTLLTDLTHTKLEVDFNWENSTMNGKAIITCSPHFYATDSLILDAKAMTINSVSIQGEALEYKYNDGLTLRIGLGKEYTRNDEYTIEIDYVANPEKVEAKGSAAISGAKGLYFINPKGEDPHQMPQIWTQGETEASSVWFPTIDRPNQKMTQEIFMTVDDKYLTLSNGYLVESKKNNDGTRTDYWKREYPAAPYLSMMAVGEFVKIEDFVERKDGSKMEVNYYVEPEWAEYAKDIFGATPDMIKFFEDVLGVEYAWHNYEQIVAREYVSGAMENTEASLFGDFVYKTKRELLDGHSESIIAHELFHHWFGNLVTLESWSNLPLNESFANYSQYLWDEFRYGKEEADYNAQQEADGYYQTAAQMGHHDLVWYDYDFIEQMFDAHAYNKGGRILHMLRTYVGDSAFFQGLKVYLDENRFGTAEMANLRMAMEKVTGEDLNWFFDQWFFASHHPKLKVDYKLDGNDVTITVEQTQNLDDAPLYKLPLNLALFANGEKQMYPIVVDQSKNEFTFTFEGELENIILDSDRALLGEVSFSKPREWYVHQYYNGTQLKDRQDAVKYGSRLRNEQGEQLILDALKDSSWVIRKQAMGQLNKLTGERKDGLYSTLSALAQADDNSGVRSTALSHLSKKYFSGNHKEDTRNVLKRAIEKDSSYLVVGTGLEGLLRGNKEDKEFAMEEVKSLENEPSSALKARIMSIYKDYGDESHLDYMAEVLSKGEVGGYDAIGALFSFTGLLQEQEIETQQHYIPVLKRLSEKGDAYISQVLPLAIMNLKRSAENQIQGMKQETERLEEEGKGGESTMIQKKIEVGEEYVNGLMELIGG